MKILLLMSNPSVEEFIKKQKEDLEKTLLEPVIFNSYNCNAPIEEQIRNFKTLKPDLIIYRYVQKENRSAFELFAKLKSIKPACKIYLIADTISLNSLDYLYDLDIHDFFVGNQIEINKIIFKIKESFLALKEIKERNLKIINGTSFLEGINKVNYFLIAENLLPEGVILPNKYKRVSLSYNELSPEKEIFKIIFSINYFNENGIEITKNKTFLSVNAKKVIEDLNSFNFKKEDFLEDLRYSYSSYDIIYNQHKIHGNMYFDGLFKEVSEYTNFDKIKQTTIEEFEKFDTYEEFIRYLEEKFKPVEEVIEIAPPKKKKLFFSKNK